MSQLLCNIDSIISAFDNYAKSDGDCATLSKGELKRLIQKEFAEVIVNPYDAQTVGTVFQLLDADCDGQVDFEEFMVLVFRVARACYKKERACQVQVAEQPEKSGAMQYQSQGKRTPSRGSPRRSTQQPQIPGRPDCHATEQSQASSRERKPSQLETGGQSREPVKCTQEPTGQTSGSGPAERQTEEDQEARRDQSCKRTSGAQRTEQDHTQQLPQEPPSQVECSSRRWEPQTQEDDSAQVRQASQQSVAQEPQGQTQNLSGQQEHKPQTLRQLSPTQQCTQEKEQSSSQGQIKEVQRREQEATAPKPQEIAQRPSCGQVREPQRSEQRGSRQSTQESQADQAAPELQQEKTQACPEQHQARQREQNSHAGERITCQQESLTEEEGPAQEGCSPCQSTTQQASGPPRQQDRERQTPEREGVQQLTQNPQVPEQRLECPRESEPLRHGQGPACGSEEASQKPEAVSPQQPTPVGQRAEQVSTGWLRRDTRMERELPTGQRECRPSQGLETNRAGQREQEPPSPQKARTRGQEHESSETEHLRGAQAPAEGQSCHQDRKPEKGLPFPGEPKPQTSDGGQRSGSTETPPAQGPRESSARQGFKTSPPSSQQVQRPPQVAPHWTSKQ